MLHTTNQCSPVHTHSGCTDYLTRYKYPLPLFLFSTPLRCSDTGNDWEVWLHNGLQYRLYLHRRDLPHCAQERWHGNVLLRCTHRQYHSPICHLFRYVNADWSVTQTKLPNNVFAPGCPKWSYYHQSVDCHRVTFIAFAHKDISTLIETLCVSKRKFCL